MAGRNIDEKLRCSFCNKTQDQVKKLIAGHNGVYICDECVETVSYTHPPSPRDAHESRMPSSA